MGWNEAETDLMSKVKNANRREIDANLGWYYLRSIPLVHFDFLVEEILAFQ
jgi:hypothetical protein